MVGDSLIRRLPQLARQHAWDGAAILLFVVALAAGIRPVIAGAGRLVAALVPASEAEASSTPPPGPSVARLAVGGFASSRYAPQLLFPVADHRLPLWLELRGGIGVAPPASSAASAALNGIGAMRPAIAICIDDLGEDLAGTDRAMALPKAVALAFLPYAETTPFLAEEAEKKGHDVLAHVPMEALSAIDPGPMTLKAGAGDIAEKIAWDISRVPGLKGVNNHEGSRFTEDETSLAPVMQALAAKGLFFFDSRTVADSKGVAVARRFGVMSAGRDVFLDNVESEEDVRRELDLLAANARRRGVAIAIGHPHEVTLKVLAAWLAKDHGVELISLPEAIRRKSEERFVAGKRNGPADRFE
jgi:hypothetical protein